MKIVLKAKKHAALLSYKSGYGYKHYSLLKKLNEDKIYEVYETTKKWDSEEAIGEEKLAKLIIEEKSSVAIFELVLWLNKLISEGLVVVTNGTKDEVQYLEVCDKKWIVAVYPTKRVLVTIKEFLKFFTFTEVE